jgi:Rad3-related DNA helicase
MKHQKHLSMKNFMQVFPWGQYPKMRPNQEKSLEIVEKVGGSVIFEAPTGSGKTAIGYTILKSLEQHGLKPLFYTAPTKAIVNQVKELHPEVKVIYGRNEYQCLYYRDSYVSAEESPCSMLDCPHRVDMETGETEAGGVHACPYLQAKFEAMQGGIIVCTTAFYLFTQLFLNNMGDPAGLVIDEAHKIANVVRNCLSYEITDYHLEKVISLLEEVSIEEASIFKSFKRKMTEIVKLRPPKKATLLEAHEIAELLKDLYRIEPRDLRRGVKEAVKKGKIDVSEQREVLKKTEMITRSLTRYLKSLEYSLPTDRHKPLNYTYAYYEPDINGCRKTSYRLVIKAYYVAPIIRKILSPFTVAYSATIGDSDVFSFETGIKFPFYSLGSDFPSENTRIYIPQDTPNLAMKARRRQDLTRTLRHIAKACMLFSKKDMRSLVVVISEKERQKFLELCEEEKVKAISYGNGVKPREAAKKFKTGEGDVLVGTAANFGEGIDLPKQIAPVIFFLRPGYPNPSDPGTVFEERRNGSQRWKLWNWRVMIEAMQVRGRNVRSAKDLGVTIFVSQQFRRFIPAVLPEWLKESYAGDLTLDKCVQEAKELLI